MVNIGLRWMAPAALCAVTLTAPAQTSPPDTGPKRPDPLDAETSVPSLVYRSSLAQARAAEPGNPVAWRDANDTVTRIGGWRAYAREAQEATPTPRAPIPVPPASTTQAAGRDSAKPLPTPTPTPKGQTGPSGHHTP